MRKPHLFDRSNSEEIQINLTPLIDVVFVILIMFIVIAPILEKDRINLAQANAKQPQEMTTVQENSPIAIYVRADNTIWMSNQLVNTKELLSKLIEARKNDPHYIPQLFHDKQATFGTYQMVKNTIETAGFEQLDVILEP